MQFLITGGLGSAGNGSKNATLVTSGLGASGSPTPASCLALQVLAVENFTTYLVLSFSNNIVVDGPGLVPANYVIEGEPTMRVDSIEVLSPGHMLKLNVSRQKSGIDYTITLPEVGIVGLDGNVLNSPFVIEFEGQDIPTSIQISKTIDQRTIDIVFNEAVLEADATDKTKYSISPTLTVVKAVRITDFHYRLTTSAQTFNTVYTVSISGIRDINGDL